jgi:hypothetical protein
MGNNMCRNELLINQYKAVVNVLHIVDGSVTACDSARSLAPCSLVGPIFCGPQSPGCHNNSRTLGPGAMNAVFRGPGNRGGLLLNCLDHCLYIWLMCVVDPFLLKIV